MQPAPINIAPLARGPHAIDITRLGYTPPVDAKPTVRRLFPSVDTMVIRLLSIIIKLNAVEPDMPAPRLLKDAIGRSQDDMTTRNALILFHARRHGALSCAR